MLSPSGRAASLTAAYYVAVFGALGAHLPYWPVWLEAWSLTPAEIAWFLGAATAARIVGTSLLPAIADRYAIRRLVIIVTASATALVHLAHLWIATPDALLIATLIAAVVMAPAPPMGDALGLRAAARFEFAYAPVRAVGSVAFLAVNVGLGAAIGTLGPDAVLWTVVVGFTAVAALGALHPGGGAAPGDLKDRTTTAEALHLLRLPLFLLFVLTAATGQASHMVYYAYSVLDWRAQGIADLTIGWLWAIGVLAETLLMLGPGRHWIMTLGPARALMLGGLAGTLRWIAMALGPAEIWLWPLQILHALSFGLSFLAAMAFLSAALPGRMIATASGLKGGLLGGGISAGTLFAAGAVVAIADLGAAYWLAAALSLMSLVLAWALGRAWDGGRIVSD